MNELLQCYIYSVHPRTLHNQVRLLLWCEIKSLAYEIIITECMLVPASCMTLVTMDITRMQEEGLVSYSCMQENVPVTSSYYLG